VKPVTLTCPKFKGLAYIADAETVVRDTDGNWHCPAAKIHILEATSARIKWKLIETVIRRKSGQFCSNGYRILGPSPQGKNVTTADGSPSSESRDMVNGSPQMIFPGPAGLMAPELFSNVETPEEPATSYRRLTAT
jgi:hypothetical protein